jgi:dolichol-phosphate mannosyltransferase
MSIPSPSPHTLVVMPTLNEYENIETALRRIRIAAPGVDILVVDDASPDGTAERAEVLAAELGQITVARRTGAVGLGSAYREGLQAGLDRGYDVLVEMDADLSHDPGALPTLLAGITSGADLAIGSRYVLGGDTVNWPRRRRALSRFGCWYARRMLALPARDVTSGFRAYRSWLLEAIDLGSVRTPGYGFQIEMVYRAARAGAAIAEVPIHFRDREAGESKMSTSVVAEAFGLVTRIGLRDRIRRSPGTPAPAGARAALVDVQ